MRGLGVALIALLVGCSNEGAGAIDCTDLVPSPGGFVARGCVHEVPNGASVETLQDGTTVVRVGGREVDRFAPCPCGADASIVDAPREHDAGLTCGIPACDGERQVELDVCLGRGLPGTTALSAGLYRACLVDPSSKLYVVTVTGDAKVQTAGWTHSAWGNGNVPSTLNAADEARCQPALLASPISAAPSCKAPITACAAGTSLVSPGCAEPKPTWTKGCYASCSAVGDDAKCPAGFTCQQTWIDPCLPTEPGQASCDACGQQTYLCLAAPTGT